MGIGVYFSVLEGSLGGLCWCVEFLNGFSFCLNEMIFSWYLKCGNVNGLSLFWFLLGVIKIFERIINDIIR